jgi:hypothetical protein
LRARNPDGSKQALKTYTDAEGKFRRGNPGRPKGARHKTTLAIEALLDGQAEKLTETAIQMALGGDVTAMRLCLDRLAPAPKDRPIQIAMPRLAGVQDMTTATAAVVEAVTSGTITPSEGEAISKLIEVHRRAVELVDLDARLTRLEQQKGQA